MAFLAGFFAAFLAAFLGAFFVAMSWCHLLLAESIDRAESRVLIWLSLAEGGHASFDLPAAVVRSVSKIRGFREAVK